MEKRSQFQSFDSKGSEVEMGRTVAAEESIVAPYFEGLLGNVPYATGLLLGQV